MIDSIRASLVRMITARHSAHRIYFNIAIALLIVLGAGLILFSPIALEGISTFKGPNWRRLSDVGQTYGAVSAIVSGVALAAISVSLILQARELNLSRAQVMRSYHLDLMKFSIENPSLLSSWGVEPPINSNIEDMQRIGFTNMLVTFWKTSYEIKSIDSNELRSNFSTMFQGEAGRKYWAASRNGWIRGIEDHRTDRFVKIIEEEYWKAIDSGPPRVSSTLSYDAATNDINIVRMRLWNSRGTQLLVGFGAGILAANAVHRNRILKRPR
jgi:hypothetical protein